MQGQQLYCISSNSRSTLFESTVAGLFLAMYLYIAFKTIPDQASRESSICFRKAHFTGCDYHLLLPHCVFYWLCDPEVKSVSGLCANLMSGSRCPRVGGQNRNDDTISTEITESFLSDPSSSWSDHPQLELMRNY